MLKSDGKGKNTFVAVEPVVPVLNTPQDGVKESTNIVTEPSRTTVVDFDRIPKQYLLQYADGSEWPTTYYQKLVGKNDPLKVFDPKVDTPNQQYNRINNLGIRVTEPLSRTQDSEKKTFSITGAGTVVNSIPPNVNDVFVSGLGDNRFGIFNVLTSERMANNKIATYQITYALLYETTPAIDRILKECTVREYYYVRERAWMGEDTLLTEAEYNRFLALGERMKDIEGTYVRRFYDQEVQSLRYPNDDTKLYDVFLAMFVKAIGLYIPGKDIHIYPHPPKLIQDVETLFTAIINQQGAYLTDMNRELRTYGVRTFRTLQMPNTIAWSKFTATMFFTLDNKYNQFPADHPKFKPFETMDVVYRGNEGETLPAFLPVTVTPYVLSEHFYNGSYSSGLEYGLCMYLKKLPVSAELVLKLAELVMVLPRDAQFYYVPLVYVLLKYVR